MSNQISRTIVICSGSEGARIYFTRWGYTSFASTPMRTKCYQIKSPKVHDYIMRQLANNMPNSLRVNAMNSVQTVSMHYNAFYHDATRQKKDRAKIMFDNVKAVYDV